MMYKLFCMKVLRFVSWLIFSFLLSLFIISLSNAGSLWLIAGEPQTAPQSGDVFETELQFSSWDLTIGAYKIAVDYDPAVLRILNVSPPSQSEFFNNTFADEDSFDSGTTHICAFQTESQSQQDTPVVFVTIQWEAIGAAGSSSEIELEPKTLVDPMWRPFDVTHLIPTTVTITEAQDLCECDLNTDGICDMQDWLLFGEDWGRTDCNEVGVDCECDLNVDGICDMQDWLLFGEDWGRTDCP